MKGTEKQIAYAKSILADFFSIVEKKKSVLTAIENDEFVVLTQDELRELGAKSKRQLGEYYDDKSSYNAMHELVENGECKSLSQAREEYVKLLDMLCDGVNVIDDAGKILDQKLAFNCADSLSLDYKNLTRYRRKSRITGKEPRKHPLIAQIMLKQF